MNVNSEKERLLKFKIKKDGKLEDWFTLRDGDTLKIVNPNRTDYSREEKCLVYYDSEDCYRDKSLYYGVASTCYYKWFAEEVEKNKLIVTPLRKSLPKYCYILLNNRGQIAKLTKGKQGYKILDEINCEDLKTARQLVTDLNNKLGVSAVQEMAMYIGAMCGWDKDGADPDFYKDTSIEIYLGQLPGRKN